MDDDKFVKEVEGRSTSRGPREKKPVDWDMVKKLSQIQCTQEEICSFLEIGAETLRVASHEVFGCAPGEMLAEWRQGGNCSLRRKQWQLADTSAAVAIFLGKQYLGQDDDYNLNHNGSMVQVVHYGDEEPKQWTDPSKKVEDAKD